MTKKRAITIARLKSAIKREQAVISDSRDRLRTLVCEAEELADEWDDAIDSIEYAVEALSQSQ